MDALLSADPALAELVRVNEDTGCWEFTGFCETHGYARIRRKGVRYRVHRYVYELLVGAVPTGLVLDHLCRVRHCVNPAHLEPVTNRENLLRGSGPTSGGLKSHCYRGHPYDESNTAIEMWHGTPQRKCRACMAERRARKRAQT